MFSLIPALGMHIFDQAAICISWTSRLQVRQLAHSMRVCVKRKNVLRKCYAWDVEGMFVCLSHCHGGLPSSAVSAVTFKDHDVRAGYMRGEAGLNLATLCSTLDHIPHPISVQYSLKRWEYEKYLPIISSLH